MRAHFGDLLRLALLLHENHDLDASGEQYLLLLRFRPDNAGLHNNYGIVLLDQRRVDEAMGQFDEAQRLDPQMAEAHHNYAICLALKKNLDGAITEFHRALDLNPEEPHSHEWLGAALSQKGNVAEAMDEFQQAVEKNPKDARVHASLGGVLLQLKEEAGAIKELKLALELKPEDPEAANNLAWVYATADDPKLRNPVEALRLARIAVEKSPSPNPAYLDTLAEALVLNGKPAEALALEEKALALDPQNPELQSRMARFRQAAGPAPSSNN